MAPQRYYLAGTMGRIETLLSAGCALLLAACTPGTSFDDPRVFRYNETAGITSLDPAHARSLEPMWVVDALFDGLLELGPDLALQPSLAATWDVSDDLLTFTFRLRAGVRFAADPAVPGLERGRPVTAADVVYSLERLRDPAVASSGGWILDALDTTAAGRGITAPDAATVQFRLAAPFPPFPGLLATPYASVVPREAVDHYGAEFRRHPVGTGPFKLAWWEEDVALVLHRNPDYFERDADGVQLPYLEAVHIDFATDPGAEFQGLLQGRYDFVSGLHPAYLEEALTESGELRPELADRIRYVHTPFLKTDYIGVLCDPSLPIARNHPLLDVRVRRALSLALDRESIAVHLRRGAVEPTDRFTPPGLPGMAREGEVRRDVEEARRLLAEAGFPGGRGLPEIALATTSDYTDLCAALQHTWAELGVRVAVEVLTPAVHRERVAQGEVMLFRKSWLADYADAENFLATLLSSNAAPAGPNYTRYASPQYDALLAAAMRTPGEPERAVLYRTLDSIVAAELPVIPLFHDRVAHFVRHGITGWTVSPVNRLDLRRVRKERLPSPGHDGVAEN
jgi:peptide/nickel transport system substrate-binding protein